ncbi:MAG: crosslink repair DNA glycosylase YcaQ family protein [Dehalococcoidia bacterium]
MPSRLELTRPQILAFRQRVGSLGERLARGPGSLRRAAWAGLQDSMPRAALLSLHARVEGITPQAWEDASLVQVWGPRFSAYVVAERDRAVFTRGRLPTAGAGRQRAEQTAARLDAFLGDDRMPYGEAGRSLGVNPNQLRYAAPTGTVLLRWDGARQPVIWMVPPPAMDEQEARLELARRHLHAFGPSTPAAFAKWAGVKAHAGAAAFDAIRESVVPVRTPTGEAWILAEDEQSVREEPGPVASARLLPSGDAYYLLWGEDRDLLVADPARRRELWTSRVWPGALLVEGEIVGIWRRAQHKVSIETWRRLSRTAKQAVEAEAATLPLPDLDRAIAVTWD